MKLRVTRKAHSRVVPVKGGGKRRVRLMPGDTFEGTERELAAFRDRLEKAGPDKPKAEDSKPEAKSGGNEGDGTQQA